MALETFSSPLGERQIARLDGEIDHLPYSIKVLLEAALRKLDGRLVREVDVERIRGYQARSVGGAEIPFIPGRVVLQDFTGVPAVVDLAAMRSALARTTGDDQLRRPRSTRASLAIWLSTTRSRSTLSPGPTLCSSTRSWSSKETRSATSSSSGGSRPLPTSG